MGLHLTAPAAVTSFRWEVTGIDENTCIRGIRSDISYIPTFMRVPSSVFGKLAAHLHIHSFILSYRPRLPGFWM